MNSEPQHDSEERKYHEQVSSSELFAPFVTFYAKLITDFA